MLLLYVVRTAGPPGFWVHPYCTEMALLHSGVLLSTLNDILSVRNSKKKTRL